MRIAYVCHWNLDGEDGVSKKVETQARTWRDAGHEVTVFTLAPGQAGDRAVIRAFPYGDRRAATRALVRAVREARPDAVYLRYDLFLPSVWSLARNVPTVVEVNSDDRAEARNWRGPVARAYNELNRRVLLGRAAGIVYVTRELATSPSFAPFRDRRHAVVANGIVLGPEPAPARPGARTRAVFLGSARQPWHGVDKLARLAAALPDVDVDVVGYTPDQLRAAGAELPSNLRVHGWLTRAEYEPLLTDADLGVGTLALHRKGMREAAPLKVREYLAAGLPIVIGYDDVDLAASGDPWWLLRVPNTDADVDPTRFAEFAASVRGRRVPQDEIRPLISVEAKERARLELLAFAAGRP